MLNQIDKLAGWWLDRRTREAATVDRELTDFQLKKVVIEDDGLTIEGVSPIVAMFAEEAARMLDKANAENYLQFDMFPRLDRGLKCIRITVAWAHGKSPAQRVIEMEARVAELEAKLGVRDEDGRGA